MQNVKKQTAPFEIIQEIPNNETKEALKEVEEMKKKSSLGKAYTDIDKMLEDLQK